MWAAFEVLRAVFSGHFLRDVALVIGLVMAALPIVYFVLGGPHRIREKFSFLTALLTDPSDPRVVKYRQEKANGQERKNRLRTALRHRRQQTNYMGTGGRIFQSRRPIKSDNIFHRIVQDFDEFVTDILDGVIALSVAVLVVLFGSAIPWIIFIWLAGTSSGEPHFPVGVFFFSLFVGWPVTMVLMTTWIRNRFL